MLHLHSTLAIVLLLALVVAILITLANYAGNKPFNRKIALIGLISAHLQLIIGFILYFTSSRGFENLSGETMKDSVSRLYTVEHPIAMVLAIVLITIGYSKAKKIADPKKANQTVLIFYVLGLILALSRIPYATWSILN
ncbi:MULTISPECIES: hypothetical protein [Sphingobacterium]|uniref:50S ribosomal protein L27 n=1 Tax=Sphingobacterium tenebrionis TaxID=3111775 RepID=A0ABU8I9I0_9SPHI|nr:MULTISPECIES: hypothetical protein [unclassified Sphingobacterium]QBR12713.1 hypothetical protein E3D81_11280 [Sphingobacterium sp. CZ-2]